MKKWKKRLVLVLFLMTSLILILSPTSALAQSEDGDAAGSRPFLKGSLAIVAPRIAGVGKEISMTVFLRANQEPFEGAGIWALTRDEAEVLKEEMAALREDTGVAAEEKDYEALVDIRGTFLGRTGEDGRLYHTFEEAGAYVLAAVKKGYFPGFTSIHIGEMPRALTIEAPRRAPVEEEVSMIVSQRGTEEPVEGVGIWAITRDEVEVLKEELAVLREETSLATEEKDYESLVSIHGTFLGRTDEYGQLSHIFEEEGGYLLVAVRGGYLPGFAPIGIGTMPDALVIEAPRRAPVGEEVTMIVSERGTGEPVKDAGIWALTRDEAEALKEELARIKEENDNVLQELDYESLVNVRGIFLGTTHGNGQLKHTFDEEGWYLLIAVKQGYIPGRTGIAIKAVPDALAIEAPRRAPVGEEVAMTVLRRGIEEPFEGAGIWALTRDEVEVLKEEMTTLREDGSLTAEEKDYEALVDIHGTFLGRTDEYGQLSHVFEEEGGYLLVTVKRGYIPGFAPILIGEMPKADVLQQRGVQGKSLSEAPGLQKPFSEKPQVEKNSGKN